MLQGIGPQQPALTMSHQGIVDRSIATVPRSTLRVNPPLELEVHAGPLPAVRPRVVGQWVEPFRQWTGPFSAGQRVMRVVQRGGG